MATEQDAIKVYLREDDAQWLRAHVDEDGRTIAGVIRKLVREYREQVEAKAAA